MQWLLTIQPEGETTTKAFFHPRSFVDHGDNVQYQSFRSLFGVISVYSRASSNVKKLCDTEILKDFEEEFGAENIEEHTADIITVDGQKVGSVKCKIRPITFDEVRKYTDIMPNQYLDDWYWALSPWSTEERGWKNRMSVVSPAGYIGNVSYYDSYGVRPVCILKSNIFVSKVEE